MVKKVFLFLLILVLVALAVEAGADEKITEPSLIWQRCFGGSSDDIAASIYRNYVRVFIVAGNTYQDDGNVNGNKGRADF